MAKKAKRPRSKVFLIAYSASGDVIERTELSFEDYYDGTNPLVDSSAYRAKKGIRRLSGEIYGYKGNLMQTFDTEYASDGTYLRCRAVHEDGTVIEN